MADRVRTFKDLIVWQRAFALSLEVYRISRDFPVGERFGITQELRKTVRSVSYNIAEGHKRRSTAHYLRFLGIASGSCGELETQLLLARELGYLNGVDSQRVLSMHAEVDRMLDALMRALKAKIGSR